jgi:DNA-directed RNA polymerase subunit M/transcription elongation factor TFIIS
MCPHCGSTDLDVQRQTERSAYDGTETETLVMTCRNCGHSWRAPAAIK